MTSIYFSRTPLFQHLIRYQVLKEKSEGRDDGTKSIFVRNADINEDKKLLTEVLKQDPHALSKMSPTGCIAWEEVADRLKRPKDHLYRDWINRILPTLRRHLAGKPVAAFSEPSHLLFQLLETVCLLVRLLPKRTMSSMHHRFIINRWIMDTCMGHTG